VTATTRTPRSDERDGIDYHFLSPQQFDEMRERGEFLENAVVYGQRYGVPRAPVREALEAGRDVFLRTDIQGARHIKSIVPGALAIFITAPSLSELRRRLEQRGLDKPDQIELRLRIAEEESARAAEFDYTVVNDDLDRCVDEIERIVQAEKNSSRRGPAWIE
jgi:guanylate kinase